MRRVIVHVCWFVFVCARSDAGGRRYVVCGVLLTPGVAAPACALPFLSLVTDNFHEVHLNVLRPYLLGVFISASELAFLLVGCVLKMQERRNEQSGLGRWRLTRGQLHEKMRF